MLYIELACFICCRYIYIMWMCVGFIFFVCVRVCLLVLFFPTESFKRCISSMPWNKSFGPEKDNVSSETKVPDAELLQFEPASGGFSKNDSLAIFFPPDLARKIKSPPGSRLSMDEVCLDEVKPSWCLFIIIQTPSAAPIGTSETHEICRFEDLLMDLAAPFSDGHWEPLYCDTLRWESYSKK